MELVHKQPLRILDFDCECRPLSWYAGDFNSKEITVIAWAWIDTDDDSQPLGDVECKALALSASEKSLRRMLKAFVKAYNKADIVTGHYIRGFDLPLVNGALLELGMEPLSAKLTHDTKGDLIRFQGHSKSQENLGGLLGLHNPKVGMSQADWRAANRLTREGIEYAKERAIGDVLQHIEMRSKLMSRGMLKAPQVWSDGRAEAYHP
jgi:hypothetical protein